MTKIKFEAYCCIPKSTQIWILRSFEYAHFSENVHPCDFKPIHHVLSVHSNVTAVTTMCFIGGIAFMTVVDWGNALFVPLGHLLDHPIFIITAIIIKGHFPHHTCYTDVISFWEFKDLLGSFAEVHCNIDCYSFCCIDNRN